MAFKLRSKMTEEEKLALDRKIANRENALYGRYNYTVGDTVTFKDGVVREVLEVTHNKMYFFNGMNGYIHISELHRYI